jgi:heavy metal sensor kinase
MPLLQKVSRFLRTLRVRLTIWNTAVVLMAVLVALLAVREGLRFALLSETDIVLNDEVRELLLAIERWHPNEQLIREEMERKAQGHRDRGWHIRWLDADRKTIWVGPAETYPETPLEQIVVNRDDLMVYASGSYRSVERRFARPGMPTYYIRVGTRTQFVDDDVGRLTRILAPVGLAILLLAPMGGYILADRAAAPLHDILATTERLRPSRMDERLKVRGVGDELDQLATQINRFLDRIADDLREKQEFIANAAHELRSPLAAILSSVEVTLDQPRTRAEYEELLGSIDDQCRHLGKLVNQLLQLAQAEASETAAKHFSPIRLDELTQKMVEMFLAVAEEKGVTLQCETSPPLMVIGDVQQLRQVVTNLIDNAIKFTPAGGTIVVRLETDPATHQVQFSVADSGCGIPAADRPRVFERFYQVDRARNRGEERRGNGLGLSICQVIVANHGGTIHVESTPGQGTTFIVRLPPAFK